MSKRTPIPILVPSLPKAEQIFPFLRMIDENRVYTNYGPLSVKLAHALAERLNATDGNVGATLTSNGTVAIELALRARALPGRRLCIMPSYTFIASAHAVANAGLTPYLVDVDEHTLMLTPHICLQAIARLDEAPAAVLIVSAFGAPLKIAEWEAFEQTTKIPVVFDAAAAAASMKHVGHQPQCVSLHATKALGIGEGGAIFSTNADLIANTLAMTGFGFRHASRVSVLRGGNYRISEYSAAVGLAVIAGLGDRLADLGRLTRTYLSRLQHLDLRFQDGIGTDWLTMTFNVIVPQHRAQKVKETFDLHQIGWRHWWGLGCHTHPTFSEAPRSDLCVTDALAPCVIGIPFHTDLALEQIELVCTSLK